MDSKHGTTLQRTQSGRSEEDGDEETALKSEYDDETAIFYETKQEETSSAESDETEPIKIGKTRKTVKTKKFVRFRRSESKSFEDRRRHETTECTELTVTELTMTELTETEITKTRQTTEGSEWTKRTERSQNERAQNKPAPPRGDVVVMTSNEEMRCCSKMDIHSALNLVFAFNFVVAAFMVLIAIWSLYQTDIPFVVMPWALCLSALRLFVASIGCAVIPKMVGLHGDDQRLHFVKQRYLGLIRLWAKVVDR